MTPEGSQDSLCESLSQTTLVSFSSTLALLLKCFPQQQNGAVMEANCRVVRVSRQYFAFFFKVENESVAGRVQGYAIAIKKMEMVRWITFFKSIDCSKHFTIHAVIHPFIHTFTLGEGTFTQCANLLVRTRTHVHIPLREPSDFGFSTLPRIL